MAIAVVTSTTIPGGANGGTSSSIDTTGVTLIVIAISRYTAGGALTVSDSKGNTWTALTEKASGSAVFCASRLYYCASPTVGSGHTFTNGGTGIYAAGVVIALSGTHASSPFDQQSGSYMAGSGSSILPGSVTPTEDNEIVITGVAENGTPGTRAINGGFTIQGNVNHSGGVNYGVALAYLIQTTAAAANPTWSGLNAAGQHASTIATFKVAGAASTTYHFLTLLGVGG